MQHRERRLSVDGFATSAWRAGRALRAAPGGRWKPGFVAAALPLALLFAYGFVRFMLERVFPVGATRH